MSLLGPDRLLVGRSVVDRKEARCIHCMQPIKFGPKGEPGVVHSREGMKEMGISGMCETCFDNLSGEPDDGTFLEFKRSADEDEPCPCAGGTATCRGNCPIFDKVAKQDAAQPSQAPVVQAVQVGPERTPQDYAIEHAEYMAVNGESLLAAIEALSAAELKQEETGEDDDGAVADARDDVWSATRALRSGIYEFRKRRDRASSGATTQAVRMLTEDEQAAIIDMHSTGRAQGDHECAEAIQRKFCEVNKLPAPADGVIGGV